MNAPKSRNLSVYVFLHRRSKASREQASGALRYAAEHDNWDLHVFSRPENPDELKRLVQFPLQRPDGIISGNPDIVVALQKKFHADIPTVLIDYNAPNRAHPDGLVFCDDHAIANKAAELFLPKKFAAYAFAGVCDTLGGDSETMISRNRENGFRRRLAQAGHALSSYVENLPRGTDHYLDEQALGDWLKALPKPCALLAHSDMLARSVIATCRKRRIEVPLQMAVLGVGNEPSVCECTSPTLSSLEPDFADGGYQAARMLDEIMRERPSERRTLRAKYGLLGLTERTSTRNAVGGRLRVSQALDVIRKRAVSGLTVSALASESGITPRALELAFKAASRRTVRDEILAVRLAEATRLLRQTQLRIGEIAERCGFRTDAALKAIFARRYGMSMRAWRRQNARPG
ncbi:MAG: substrate-binding domain-containing protein [Kiritimatiellia bacterium]